MAKKIILGTDIARDAFKVKVNENFTELYDKDVALGESINSLATKVIAESGSNENGSYVKFADGTAMFTRMISFLNTTNVLFNSVGTPFPLAGNFKIFVTAYDSARTVNADGAAQVAGYDITGSYRYAVKFNRETATARNVFIQILGIGVWIWLIL